MNIFHKQIPDKQSGFLTLITSLSLLIGVTLISFAVAKSGLVTHKLTSDFYRASEAFQSAEAGLEMGVAFIQANRVMLIDNDTDGYIDPYTDSLVTNVVLANGSRFSASFLNPVSNDFDLIRVTATGTSNDGLVTRSIEQIVKINQNLASRSPFPLTTLGAVNISGDITVTNTETDQTILSGGDASLSGSSSTMTSTGVSSDSEIMGADITENDAGLASMTGDQFFQTYLGGTKEQVKQSFDSYYESSAATNYKDQLDGVVGETIWIEQTSGDAKLNSGAVVGSPDHPVILVVNGNLIFNGNAVIYGVLYVAGNWNNYGGGTATVHGSVFVEGDMEGLGTPDVIYDSTILDRAQDDLAAYVKVSGSWRDLII